MEEITKYPTWQWVALVVVAMIVSIIGYGFVEARYDTRDTKQSMNVLASRMAVLEKATEIQYMHINERQKEIKESLETLLKAQKETQELLIKHEKQQVKCK
jgi:hypothetical protein